MLRLTGRAACRARPPRPAARRALPARHRRRRDEDARSRPGPRLEDRASRPRRAQQRGRGRARGGRRRAARAPPSRRSGRPASRRGARRGRARGGGNRHRLRRRARSPRPARGWTVVNDVVGAWATATGAARSGGDLGHGLQRLRRRPDGAHGGPGGWGHLLGDEGAGYWLGLESIRAALRDREASGAATALSDALVAFFDAPSVEALASLVYSKPLTKGEIAAFAVETSRIADAGDAGRTSRSTCRGARKLGQQVSGRDRADRARPGEFPVGLIGSAFKAGRVFVEPLARRGPRPRPAAPARPSSRCPRSAGSLLLAARACGRSRGQLGRWRSSPTLIERRAGAADGGRSRASPGPRVCPQPVLDRGAAGRSLPARNPASARPRPRPRRRPRHPQSARRQLDEQRCGEHVARAEIVDGAGHRGHAKRTSPPPGQHVVQGSGPAVTTTSAPAAAAAATSGVQTVRSCSLSDDRITARASHSVSRLRDGERQIAGLGSCHRRSRPLRVSARRSRPAPRQRIGPLAGHRAPGAGSPCRARDPPPSVPAHASIRWRRAAPSPSVSNVVVLGAAAHDQLELAR